MEPKSFAWHESFTRALELLPDKEDQAQFVLGVIDYGAYSNEPFFDYPLNVLFEAIRPNIDSSVKNRMRAKKASEARWKKDPE